MYDWRLWTPPELRRLLLAAGFAELEFLWLDQGRGRYRRVAHGDATPSWVAYVVARRAPAPEPALVAARHRLRRR